MSKKGKNSEVRKRKVVVAPAAYGFSPKSRISKTTQPQTDHAQEAIEPGSPVYSEEPTARVDACPIPIESTPPKVETTLQEPSESQESTMESKPERPRSNNKVKRYILSATSVFRNKFFLRAIGLVGAEVASVVLFLYSFGFLDQFKQVGSAVSYFPWSWNVMYTTMMPAFGEFYLGVEVALLSIVTASVVLNTHLIPRFQSTFPEIFQ